MHPIDETHQFRPTLTYLDYLSKKNKRSRGGDSDSEDDDNPPPDPDEAPPLIATKKERKASGAAKEVQVAARKTGEQGGIGAHAGMSAARRDMLHLIRLEEEESWVPYSVYDVTVRSAIVQYMLSELIEIFRQINPQRLLAPFSHRQTSHCLARRICPNLLQQLKVCREPIII